MKIFKNHPQWQRACRICERLQAKGYQALFAGGCVRDALMGREPKDFDIATSARPEEIEALFTKTVGVGKAFGVIVVVEEGAAFEVATFRNDGRYEDGRRPIQVEFSSLREDARRRDFTVNAMYFDPMTDRLVDEVGGQEDLKDRLLRAVGDPAVRFKEDHLRMLRAVRFASQLTMRIEEHTWEAILAGATDIGSVSKERITEELAKIWKSPQPMEGFERLLTSGMLKVLLPEADKVWRAAPVGEREAAKKLFSAREEEILSSWALFFSLFYPNSLEVYESSQPRLSFSRQQQKGLRWLLEKLEKLGDSSVNDGEKLEWLGSEFGLELLRLAEAFLQRGGKVIEASKLEALVSKSAGLMSRDGRLPAPLLSGEDLADQGIEKGPRMGALLKKLYHLQLEQDLREKSQVLELLPSIKV
jgi:tRNA nucleotidyltransferase/poly(A) polymerase